MPYVLGVIVGAMALLLAVASRKPPAFTIERSATIEAPPERIHPLIDDFHSWHCWSPFEKLDPQMNKIFSGSDNGVGAAYAWSGNRKAGAGTMTIERSTLPSNVTIAMSFLKPFKSQSTATFSLEPANALTKVTWSMAGKNTMISKVMSLFFSMDKLIGKDFAEGLANLKREAESAS